MASEKLKAWEQQKGESQKAYAAFSIYLELEHRSISKVAEKLSVSVTNVRKWSGKNNWLERAAAYDSSIVEATRKDKIKLIKKAIERKLLISDKLFDKAMAALEQIGINRFSVRGITEALGLSNAVLNEAVEMTATTEEEGTIDTIIIQRRGD